MATAGTPLAPNNIHICLGTVIDVAAGARWYTVRTGGKVDTPCTAAYPNSTQHISGAKQVGVYAPGTYVIVMILKDGKGLLCPPGYILGSVAMPVGRRDYRILDLIGLYNGSDAANDPTHNYLPTKYPTDIRDFNVGMPMDAVPGSDVGYMNELGVKQGMSRFFTWSCASELAGIWSFYLDNMTRLAAYNFEFWHSGGERTIKNDEGEVNDVDMFTPYPWEASGVLKPKIAVFQVQTDGGKHQKGQYKFPYEPKEVDQCMIPRWMRLRGYLGDMHREMVTLPIINPTDYKKTDETYVARLSEKTKHTGVLDVHQHSSGLYSVRSAQGIHFEKYIYIPVPKQMAVPEETDEKGDGATNYSPAGVWGPAAASASDPTVAIHDKSPWPWTDKIRPDTWVAELWDYSAYMFNWYGIKPTLAHTKDWYVADEGYFANIAAKDGSPAGDLCGAYVPEKALSDTFTFSLPKFASIKIDHRAGDTKYYYSRSVISQLPDGSIIIEDGYGTSMHMVGGNMYLSGAGDVWLKPGRSIVMWAGDDLVARAGSSVDISASNADVRIKAERNLHILGGNSGVVGGVLIESRSNKQSASFKFKDGSTPLVGEDVETYGIMLKTTTAPILMYGSDIYGKAVASSSGAGELEFEADGGIVLSGKSHIRYAQDNMTDIIGQTLAAGAAVSGGSIVNYFDKKNAVYGCTDLFRAKASVAVFDSTNGMYATGHFAVVNGIVPFPSGTVESTIAGFSTDYTNWLASGLAALTTFYYDDVYNADAKGNQDFINIAGFTCRNEIQYGLTSDFYIVEARWQQVYRAAGLGVLWNEPVVAVPGSVTVMTRPHPGNAYWSQVQLYVEYDTDLWAWKSESDSQVWSLKDKARAVDTGASNPYDTARKNREGASIYTAQKPRLFSEKYKVSIQYMYT